MDLDPDRHPFGGEWYGEYPDSEQESEDPEVDLEPEPASGSGKVSLDTGATNARTG